MDEQKKRRLIAHYVFLNFEVFLEQWKTPDRARFPLGLIVSTPGAVEALQANGKEPHEYLQRHQTGEWGDLCDDDKEENELSVKEGFRILSAYRLPDGKKLWVITEHDRSVTTLLLPSEY